MKWKAALKKVQVFKNAKDTNGLSMGYLLLIAGKERR
jgi:hypothetical protein